MAVFRINISKMSEGEHRFSFEAEPAAVGLGPEFLEKVQVEAVLEKRNRQILLRADIKSAAAFECDRCLETFSQKLEARYSILYVTENEASDGEDGRTEVVEITPDTNTVDLDEDVRQYLLLSVPQKLLCREDCRGLCPECGKNLNDGPCSCKKESGDPRWEALKGYSGN